MAREFSRTDRVGSQMQRELAVLVREELDDPHLGMITIQAVRVTRDFSYAKVYFTVMGGQKTPAETAGLLNEAAPFFPSSAGPPHQAAGAAAAAFRARCLGREGRAAVGSDRAGCGVGYSEKQRVSNK